MFRKLEGDSAITVQKGVFRHVDVFAMDGNLFLGHGSGYIRAYEDGSTSKDGVNIRKLHCDAPLFKDTFGRLLVEMKAGAQPLASNVEEKLKIGVS